MGTTSTPGCSVLGQRPDAALGLIHAGASEVECG